MSNVYLHPRVVYKLGAGDLQREWHERGYHIGNVPGSKFVHIVGEVDPPPYRPSPEPSPTPEPTPTQRAYGVRPWWWPQS